jgi:SulP family sulfate permease
MARMSRSVEMGPERDFITSDADDGDQRDTLPEGVEVFRIAGPLFFGVTRDLLDVFRQMGRMPDILIIRMRYVPMMDASAAAALSDLAQTARRQGVILIFSAVRPGPAAMLARAGVTTGAEGIYFAPDYRNAVDLACSLHTKKA